MKRTTCRERLRYNLDGAILVAYFGAAYAVEWIRKRAKGDKSPVVVFVAVQTRGAR